MYVGWKTWSANRNSVFSPRSRWVPESARWLIANGKVKRAHRHLLRCARMNGRKDFAVSPEVRNWRSRHMFFLSHFLSLCFTAIWYLKWSTGCHAPFYSRKQLHPRLKIKQQLSSRRARNPLHWVECLSIHYCHGKKPQCTGLNRQRERRTAWKSEAEASLP